MRVAGKTISYWWEKIGGLCAGIIVCSIIVVLNPTFSNWRPLIIEFPAIGMCVFGFLLTFLGIILQGNSDTIKWMMSRDDLYNRFIAFNKRIVIISFVLSLYSYILGYVDFQVIIGCLSSKLFQIIKNVSIGTFCGLLVWFIIDTFQFTRLFFVLIRKTEKK